MDISAPKANASEGRILCLHPDGHWTVFAEKLFAVFGMQYLEGKLFVLHNPKFSVFTDGSTFPLSPQKPPSPGNPTKAEGGLGGEGQQSSGVGRDRVDLIEQTNPNQWALDGNE